MFVVYEKSIWESQIVFAQVQLLVLLPVTTVKSCCFTTFQCWVIATYFLLLFKNKVQPLSGLAGKQTEKSR